jgi:hypothetical protein
MLVKKGIATPTVAAPPTTLVATSSSLRRPPSTGFALMPVTCPVRLVTSKIRYFTGAAGKN